MNNQTEKETIEDLKKQITLLKEENTKYLEEIQKSTKEEPVMLNKILAIANEYGLNEKQKEDLINEAIKMADNFRKENKKNNK